MQQLDLAVRALRTAKAHLYEARGFLKAGPDDTRFRAMSEELRAYERDILSRARRLSVPAPVQLALATEVRS